MDSHVKLLGILHIVAAGLNILAGLAILAALAAIRQFLDIPDDASFLAILVGIIPLALVIISLPGLLAGMGLLNRAPWSRVLALIVGAFHLPNVPIGTALGIYTFWVLLNEEAGPLFDRR